MRAHARQRGGRARASRLGREAGAGARTSKLGREANAGARAQARRSGRRGLAPVSYAERRARAREQAR